MCFFFIIGVMPRGKRIGTELRYCALCGRETMHTLYERRLWFNLFFIPLFPVSRKETTARCDNCGTEDGQASTLGPLSQPQRRANICPNCGAESATDARFCQYCGRAL